MPTPDLHGASLHVDTPDTLPDWYLEDPDMWSGLSMDMGTFLALERATEGDGDDGH